MTLVGYIGKISGIHYYYTSINDITTVMEFEGADGPMKAKLISNKCSAMLYLFEQFLIIDKALIDPGKTFAYTEKVKRINAFLEWGIENQTIAPESVIQNGFLSKKYMQSMIKSISKDHPSKKELILLYFNVTLLYNSPYNI